MAKIPFKRKKNQKKDVENLLNPFSYYYIESLRQEEKT